MLAIVGDRDEGWGGRVSHLMVKIPCNCAGGAHYLTLYRPVRVRSVASHNVWKMKPIKAIIPLMAALNCDV